MAKSPRTKAPASSPAKPSHHSPMQKPRSDAMAIEYLLVTYPDQRSVLADGAAVGITNHTLMLPSDEYVITLDGSGYKPASQDIVLSGTSIVKPMVIAFTIEVPERTMSWLAGL